MNKIEEYKKEKDGLDILHDLPRYAGEGWQAIDEGDKERLKWAGVFFRRQTPGVQNADFVALNSRRGKVVAQCRVTEEIVSGACFLPFHWGRNEGFYKAANNLTLSARDPLSLQPD